MFTGYDPSKERLESLEEMASEYRLVCKAGERLNIPDPATILPLLMQGSWPSCGGHMLAYMIAWIWYLSHKEVKNFSRMFAWVESQRVDGRPSQRDGISIYAAMKVATTIGIPEEHYAPYKVGNWYDTFSTEAYENALLYKVDNLYKLDDPEKVIDFASAGMGAVGCGVPWEGGMRSWHALAALASFEDGIRGPNSWPISADKYGPQDGWYEWVLRKLEWYMSFRGSVFYGLSDLSTPQVRKGFDWTQGGLV